MADDKKTVFVGVSEAAKKIGCSEVTVRTYIRQGKMKAKKHLNKWFIPLEEVKKFEFTY